MSPRTLLRAGATVIVLSACGRLGLAPGRRVITDSDASSRGDGGRAAVTHSSGGAAGGGAGGASHLDANAPETAGGAVADAQGHVHDASSIESGVHDASVRADAVADGPMEPDCRCPLDDYYVDATVNGEPLKLRSAYRLGLYCFESAVELAHPSCGTVYRLTACAGLENAPPCLYVAVDGEKPILGHFVDATGQTFDMTIGDIAPASATGRLAIGTFSATFGGLGADTSIQVAGVYHACTTLFQPCKT